MASEVTDEQIAAWVREVNHGVPPWEVLSEEARVWWRNRYFARHPEADRG